MALMAVSTVAVGLLLTWYVYGNRSVITDQANSRSLHQGKTTTGGGFLMFLPVCICLLWLDLTYIPCYLILTLSMLGLADDKYDLSFKLRLLIQSAVMAGCLVYFGYAVGVLFGFLMLASIWWLNLFNFMDGANGMAGLHTLVVAVFYGFIYSYQETTDVLLVFVIGVVIIYLFFNLYLNKLFMGDSGSLPMAMVLTVFAFGAITNGWLTYYQVALIHGAFIVDGTLTLMYRLYNKENITHAHASHLYQRLVKSQLSHVSVSLVYALVTVGLCVAAYVINHYDPMRQVIVLALSYALLVLIFVNYFRTGR